MSSQHHVHTVNQKQGQGQSQVVTSRGCTSGQASLPAAKPVYQWPSHNRASCYGHEGDQTKLKKCTVSSSPSSVPRNFFRMGREDRRIWSTWKRYYFLLMLHTESYNKNVVFFSFSTLTRITGHKGKKWSWTNQAGGNQDNVATLSSSKQHINN